jgi:pterin-4a-carbinolamine dehydratase
MHIYYNKIVFELQRFDADRKVTDKDFVVAKEIENKYKNR